MSSKTLYYCDHCKKECEHKELTQVKIELDPSTRYKTKRFTSVYKYFDLCNCCTIKLGFVKVVNTDKEVKVEPSTADKLYDLICNIVWEQGDN
jgi:hypothetical protein